MKTKNRPSADLKYWNRSIRLYELRPDDDKSTSTSGFMSADGGFFDSADINYIAPLEKIQVNCTAQQFYDAVGAQLNRTGASVSKAIAAALEYLQENPPPSVPRKP